MSRNLVVLIVEDNPNDAELFLVELRRHYRVQAHIVETREAMWEALRDKKFDVIFSDYSLPHFSVEGALALVREMKLDLPFIVISGAVGEEEAVGILKAGAHDFLLKGKFGRLFPAIERELKEAEIRKNHREAVDEIRRLNKYLEKTVEERTMQLRNMVEYLQREMAEKVKTEEEVRRLNESLEEKIFERTAQLENANRLLREELLRRQ